jgi:hypothetical protein
MGEAKMLLQNHLDLLAFIAGEDRSGEKNKAY